MLSKCLNQQSFNEKNILAANLLSSLRGADRRIAAFPVKAGGVEESPNSYGQQAG